MKFSITGRKQCPRVGSSIKSSGHTTWKLPFCRSPGCQYSGLHFVPAVAMSWHLVKGCESNLANFSPACWEARMIGFKRHHLMSQPEYNINKLLSACIMVWDGSGGNTMNNLWPGGWKEPWGGFEPRMNKLCYPPLCDSTISLKATCIHTIACRPFYVLLARPGL